MNPPGVGCGQRVVVRGQDSHRTPHSRPERGVRAAGSVRVTSSPTARCSSRKAPWPWGRASGDQVASALFRCTGVGAAGRDPADDDRRARPGKHPRRRRCGRADRPDQRRSTCSGALASRSSDPHGTHRSAEPGGPSIDAEAVGQAAFHLGLVADRDQRAARAPGRPSRPRLGGWSPPGIRRAGWRRPRTTVRVQRVPAARDALPPSGGRMPRAGRSGHVGVTGQGMADEDGDGDPPVVIPTWHPKVS